MSRTTVEVADPAAIERLHCHYRLVDKTAAEVQEITTAWRAAHKSISERDAAQAEVTRLENEVGDLRADLKLGRADRKTLTAAERLLTKARRQVEATAKAAAESESMIRRLDARNGDAKTRLRKLQEETPALVYATLVSLGEDLRREYVAKLTEAYRRDYATLVALARISTKFADVRASPPRYGFQGDPAVPMPLEFPSIRLRGSDDVPWGQCAVLNGEVDDAERRLLNAIRTDLGVRI